MKLKIEHIKLIGLLAFIGGMVLSFREEMHSHSITLFFVWFFINLFFAIVKSIKWISDAFRQKQSI